MQIPALAWLIPAHNATTSRGIPGRFTSRVYNFLEHKLLLAVKTALTGAGHPVSALINDGMLLQDGAKIDSKQIALLAHRTCESICPGINIPWIWPAHDATIKNSAGATFGTLREPPTFQAPPTLPPLLTPTRTPPTAAPALTQPRTPAPPATARPARAPDPPPIHPPQHRTPICRQPGLILTQTAARPPSAPIPAAALATIADALFNHAPLTSPPRPGQMAHVTTGPSFIHPRKHHAHHSHTSPGHFGSATARPSTTPYTPGRNGSATARPHHHYHLW